METALTGWHQGLSSALLSLLEMGYPQLLFILTTAKVGDGFEREKGKKKKEKKDRKKKNNPKEHCG